MTGVVGRLALAEAKSMLTGLPKWVYYAVGIALLLFLVIRWDAGRIKAAEKRGSDAAYASIEKQARAIEQKANRLTGKIVSHLKEQNHAQNSRISADAAAQLVRGTGKAACTSVAGLPGLPGRHEPPARPADVAMDRVSYPKWSDLLAVPFDGTVKFAEQHDLNLAEVQSCRSAWKQLDEAWRQIQSERTRP